MNFFDELDLFYAKDPIKINNQLHFTVPTVYDIKKYGEQDYFNAVYTSTGVGADFKWQLWDSGVDYTEIDDFDLFAKMLFVPLSGRKIEGVGYQNPMSLFFNNLDFANFKPYLFGEGKELILYNQEEDITFDRVAYKKLVDIIRHMHGLKRNSEIPGNNATKMVLIEEAKENFEESIEKPFQSLLRPILSALTNHRDFKYRHDDVWNVPINIIFDGLKQIGKLQDALMLMQGAYSGFASLKGVDTERLNWVK